MPSKTPPAAPQNPRGGAYLLHLSIKKATRLRVGSLGDVFLPSGHYVYAGSARASLPGRIGRHKRLAETGTGNLHWHIDYLLTHPDISLVREDTFIGREECEIAGRVASIPGASVPVPHFGSSDCRAGCKAHLFRLGKSGLIRLGKIK